MADRKPKELLKELRDRYKRCVDAERDNRKQAMADLKFVNVPGSQWDDVVKKARGQDRPMYEFNRARVTNKRIINEMRSNRPAGKVIGTEDNDVDTAEVLTGLCRNIWVSSDGDSVTDYAAEYQVGGGMGAWRVCTDYSSDTAFDQDIYVEAIRNPFCLYSDVGCQDQLKRDAKYWILTDRISKDSFAEKYPKAKKVNFESDSEFDDEDEADWVDEEFVRIAEYWWKEPVVKSIALLSNGASVDLAETTPEALQANGLTILKKRQVNGYKVKMAICSGDAILEGPTDWAGCEFPFVVVYGEFVIIDGKTHWSGLTRHMIAAQKAHNWAMTGVFEAIALAPTAKYWATAKQAEGNVQQWSEANAKNLPFMLYNPDPQAPGPPPRVGGPDVPAALMQASAMSGEEIKSTSGIFDPSLGAQTQETSGIAIRARQAQGELATFNYPDNMAKGIRRTWEILIDLIPKIYDTERSVRILGADGAEKFTKVNQVDPTTGKVINDLSRGKFDVAVTVGPSFSTQRQEAAETYTQLAQAFPPLMQIAGDLVMKARDLPYSDEIAERMRLMLPPQLQQQDEDGKPLPPEVQQAMAQVQQAMQQVQQQGVLVQQAAEEAQQEKAGADKAKSDVQLAISNLKVQEAQLAVSEAQFKQLVAETQLKMGEGQQTQDMANERAALEAQIQQVLGAIQAQAAEHQAQAMQVMAQMAQGLQPQVVVSPPHPRIKMMVRQNGALVPVYEDQGELNG